MNGISVVKKWRTYKLIQNWVRDDLKHPYEYVLSGPSEGRKKWESRATEPSGKPKAEAST